MPRKRVVCIGCGTGQSRILKALSLYNVELTGLVGVTDNGGHSGLLRQALHTPQVGDTRNCLAALAPDSHPLTPLLRKRLPNGVQLGNLLLSAELRRTGSLTSAVLELRGLLGIRTRLLPVSDSNTQIAARLENGRTIIGEWQIIRRAPRTPIRRLFHSPVVHASSPALEAIREADLIVFCPGTLQTGLLSALLPRGLPEAIRHSRALKVQICNLMTQPGNSDGFPASRHVQLLTRYAGVSPDLLLVNTARPPTHWLAPYRREGAAPVVVDRQNLRNIRLIEGNFLEPPSTDVMKLHDRPGSPPLVGPHFICHDPKKIGRALMRLLAESF